MESTSVGRQSLNDAKHIQSRYCNCIHLLALIVDNNYGLVACSCHFSKTWHHQQAHQQCQQDHFSSPEVLTRCHTPSMSLSQELPSYEQHLTEAVSSTPLSKLNRKFVHTGMRCCKCFGTSTHLHTAKTWSCTPHTRRLACGERVPSSGTCSGAIIRIACTIIDEASHIL